MKQTFTKGLVILGLVSLVSWGGLGNANAGTMVLDFEGVGNLESVGSFYNGGTGGSGSGPGPNFGVTFSSNALGLIDSDAGGSGNFGGEPSESTIVFFLTGSSITLNVADGFNKGLSFFYSSIHYPGSVDVFEGLDGTGTNLASLLLPVTPSNGAPDPTGYFSPFLPIGVEHSGVARSVVFGGTPNQIGFDDVTLVANPEPGTILLLGTGLAGLVAWRMRKGRA